GLANGEQLHPVQAAFVEHDGFQCGYCTPGQICSGVACMKEGHVKSDDEIREWMSGNLCRCGAYPNIVDAIKDATAKSARIRSLIRARLTRSRRHKPPQRTRARSFSPAARTGST